MTLFDVSNLRLAHQLIDSKSKASPKEIVSYMCAMQAQDYAMAKWGIGVRAKDSTNKIIEFLSNDL